MSKVSAMQNEIKLIIAKKMGVSDRNIDIGDIIEQLEKQGIVNSGDSNVETGQVKTQPDGYVFEIKEKANGDWKVTYLGNGEITKPEVIIALSVNTTGITNEVIITMTAKAESGITSYTLPQGTAQSVAEGTKEITKTITATENGTYVFTIVNGNGERVTKSIKVDNILENLIEISANKTLPTTEDVIVTVKWPSDASKGVKQIQVEEGVWQTVTGATTQITVMQNCTVTAKVKNSIGQISSASLNISNIDKTKPTITSEGTITIDYKTDKSISEYFTIIANGTADVTDIVCMNTSNGNEIVENAKELAVGTHTIKCIATKETGATTNGTITIVVEPNVYGNLYKISDTEYHLIFNGTGDIAKGYSESQLVARGDNIKDGSGRITISEGVYMSSQPWGIYSDNITKVKIEENLQPRSTSNYFRNLPKITEIEELSNLKTSDVTDMSNMFYQSKSLTSLDISGFDTKNVTNMRAMFADCNSLTSLDVSGFDTGKVTDMHAMFQACYNLTSLDVSGFDTGNVTTMQVMFHTCNKLTSLDVSGFDTGNVTSMYAMFYQCQNLTTIDVSEFDTKNTTTMNRMFYGCEKVTNLDLTEFNTENVTDMNCMFFNCKTLTRLDLSTFDTSKVIDMSDMFNGCTNLTTIYAGGKWTTNAVTSSAKMFINCTKLKGVISYDSNKIDATYANYTNGYFTKEKE